MELNITGKNMELTPALKNHTTEKLKKIERHHDKITSINVVLHIEHLTHTAEGTLYLDGTELHARATADDMYKSVDALIDKLATQITKHKEKLTGHR